jgi:hypothetical protein
MNSFTALHTFLLRCSRGCVTGLQHGEEGMSSIERLPSSVNMEGYRKPFSVSLLTGVSVPQ